MTFIVKVTKHFRRGRYVWVVNAPGSHTSPSGLACRRPRMYGTEAGAMARVTELLA
jgi:hypothetical protein